MFALRLLATSNPSTDDDFQEELRGSLDIQARLLYGLIHARWIVTARGLAKMVRRFPHPYQSNPHAFPNQTARQIQEGRFRTLPAGVVPGPATAPNRTDRRAVRKVRQAILRTLRGHLLTQVIATRLDRRRVLRHVIPASSLPRLSLPPPAEERPDGRRTCLRRSRPRARRWCDGGRSAPARTAARGIGGGIGCPWGCDQHGCGRAAGGAVPSTHLWVPGERGREAAALAGGRARQVRRFVCSRRENAL